MTFPIIVQHPIGSALTRYTQVPAVNADPGGGSEPAGGGGRITLGGTAGASGTVSTIYGYNWNDDTSYQTIAGRKLKFGNRNPCPRVYTGASGHPTTFSGGVGVDEKRLCWSFKAGDPNNSSVAFMTSSYLASTTARDGRYIPWLESIPANWEVFWCYHHEPNAKGALELPVADFKATYTRMKEAKAAATLKAGVKVHITSNFMAYQVGTTNWDNNWVPPDAEILTWDMYGNPGQQTSASGTNKYGTATGSAYGSTYPLVDQRTAAMFKVTQDTGFAASWGILEVNSPLRNWDVGEVGRKAWHQDVINYFKAGGGMTGGKPPKIVLLWEAPSGVNWVQGYGYNNATSLDTRWAGGTINYSATRTDASPIWDVWKPYITGTPVGG